MTCNKKKCTGKCVHLITDQRYCYDERFNLPAIINRPEQHKQNGVVITCQSFEDIADHQIVKRMIPRKMNRMAICRAKKRGW